MFGSIEVFLFNQGVDQKMMDFFVGKGILGDVLKQAVAGETLDKLVETTKKVFEFDLSSAQTSSEVGSAFEPVSDKAKPIHR